jgi:hypothetical protein
MDELNNDIDDVFLDFYNDFDDLELDLFGHFQDFDYEIDLDISEQLINDLFNNIFDALL